MTTLPPNAQKAIDLIRYLVKQWQCVEGTSASDLLDDTCDAARSSGIVTPDDITAWCAEEAGQGNE